MIHEDEVEAKTGYTRSEYDLGISNFNEPRTILLDYIFNIIKHQHTAIFVTSEITAEIQGANFSPVYGRYEEEDGKKGFY